MLITSHILVLGAVLCLLIEGAPSSNVARMPRIAGGQTASQDKFSFVANVVSLDSVYTGKNCTGALIGERLVMTTANCLMSSGLTWFNSDLMSVSFGDSSQNIYKVRQALISDGYHSETFTHNVGLIVLASPVPESVATPVKIYSKKFTTNTPVFAIGYGVTGRELNPYPNSPQVVPLSIMSEKECSVYKSFDPATQLCVFGGAESSLCIGDEGAPLVVSSEAKHAVALVGMASYSTEAAGTKATACGGQGRVSYFEISKPWAGWISKAAHVTYNDIIVSLNITTDSDRGEKVDAPGDAKSSEDAEIEFSDVDSALSAGIIEGPLLDVEASATSGSVCRTFIATDALPALSLMLLAGMIF
ncbi:hypothetical protein H4R24_005152 [Coemansia sp. RSA 988]|nr:hypothetical protein H4R24_005152 [Coemansia sp. RSA 988]